MIDYYCQNGQVNAERRRMLEKPSYVLEIVPHVRRSSIQHSETNRSRVEGTGRHRPGSCFWIFRRAVPALVDTLAKVPELSGRMKRLSHEDRLDLSWLVVAYSHYLTSAQAGFLSGLGRRVAAPERVPMGFLADQKALTQDPLIGAPY